MVPCATPLKFSMAPGAKFDPETLIVTGGYVAMVLVGSIPDKIGTGYVPRFTVKFSVFDGPDEGCGLETSI